MYLWDSLAKWIFFWSIFWHWSINSRLVQLNIFTSYCIGDRFLKTNISYIKYECCTLYINIVLFKIFECLHKCLEGLFLLKMNVIHKTYRHTKSYSLKNDAVIYRFKMVWLPCISGTNTKVKVTFRMRYKRRFHLFLLSTNTSFNIFCS